jgi:radical SAM protein with 4Fe4S-binding SPASM domain
VTVEAIDFHPNDGRSQEEKRRSLAALFPEIAPDRVRVKALHNWAGSYTTNGGLDSSAFKPCTFLWYSLTVLWDGRVLPCPQDTDGKLALGNVNDASLASIWEGDSLRRLREKMKSGDWQDLVPCKTCDRIFRPTKAGIPKEGWREFLWENLTR